MPITVNEGGTLYELDTITSNEGGTLYELDTVHSNEGGTLYEIHSANPVKSIDWVMKRGNSTLSGKLTISNNGLRVALPVDSGFTICAQASGTGLNDPSGYGYYLWGKTNIPSGTTCEVTINSITFGGGSTSKYLAVYASNIDYAGPAHNSVYGLAQANFNVVSLPYTMSFQTTADTTRLFVIGYGITGGQTSTYYNINSLDATFKFHK